MFDSHRIFPHKHYQASRGVKKLIFDFIGVPKWRITTDSKWCMYCGETELVNLMFKIPQILPSLTQAQSMLQCLQHPVWKKEDPQIPQLWKVTAVALHPIVEKMPMAKNLLKPSWKESQSWDLALQNQKSSVSNVEKHLAPQVLLQNTSWLTVMRENMFVQLVGKDSSVRITCEWILLSPSYLCLNLMPSL